MLLIISLARSATAYNVLVRWPLTWKGQIEASTTLTLLVKYTFILESTTPPDSLPCIEQVPTGWLFGATKWLLLSAWIHPEGLSMEKGGQSLPVDLIQRSHCASVAFSGMTAYPGDLSVKAPLDDAVAQNFRVHFAISTWTLRSKSTRKKLGFIAG